MHRITGFQLLDRPSESIIPPDPDVHGMGGASLHDSFAHSEQVWRLDGVFQEEVVAHDDCNECIVYCRLWLRCNF